ncbi:hypothetical protein VE01_05169 [Pseudogymnoascus verrucosus]|uniref:Bacteriophage T5 Orf172 DNA-binding domain-containing protein n=1 Tax=Pseudogymnoascus verrucosus TaxID=342668 RepID=A0A1B8GIA0_9PEZI|nr:uncharacterized protein VE01_05169 [Pseudogymnoascus verrucosus]OBT95538.1 hypothetical protein VE01_05169 [Pseudogymnoascus verrucosus]
MPFIPHTPESLIPRSDSRDPTATCRGLTSSGRLCRRAIATSSPPATVRLSLQSPIKDILPSDAFCWQHKDQATSAQALPPSGVQNSTIRERTSVDTLVDRLGLLEIKPEKTAGKQRRRSSQPRPILYASGTHYSEKQQHMNPSKAPRIPPRKQHNVTLLCCVGVADEDPVVARPAQTRNHTSHNSRNRPSNFQPMIQSPQLSQPSKQVRPPRPSTGSREKPINIDPQRPQPARGPSSHTQQLLSLIPKTTSPQITSLLLAELSKTPSQLDDEGYIYIFWLTSTSHPQTPPSEAASSLLDSPPRPLPGKRRTSESLQTFSSSTDRGARKTILLKIGRASNVQRRLNEWSRQCGYNLSLVRYYPYQPSSPGLGVGTPKKVPYAHRVERLIHIELNGIRARGGGGCESCGREHREWFEVEATREGVRSVDEVVRRWVDWGLRGTT